VAEFGTSIAEMQDHVTGLQKNLDTFKKSTIIADRQVAG
jgi:hypothetical protein